MSSRETLTVRIDDVSRELPLCEVAPGVRIAVFNLFGDTEVVEVAARGLARRLDGLAYDTLVTAEPKSIPLVYQLALLTGKRWTVLRKSYKPYMGQALSTETLSITTAKPQTLYLDEKDFRLLATAQVVLVDDVVSTGSTMAAMRALMHEAGAHVVAEAAVFTEGDQERWRDVIALGHLPVLKTAPKSQSYDSSP